jgi:SET domain-containing protein
MTEKKSEEGGFIVLVEVKHVNNAVGFGVFASKKIEKGTLLWTPKLVTRHTETDSYDILGKMTLEKANAWLRQAFVYADHFDFLCSNVDDDGRLVNHSSTPNTGYASSDVPSIALQDIEKGEELTCDYSGLGSPQWYKDLCKLYNVIPTDEIAASNN